MKDMFKGRYGIDKLNRTLIYGAIILSLIAMFVGLIIPEAAIAPLIRLVLGIMSAALTVIALFRMFSRNFVARQKELSNYLIFIGRIKTSRQRTRANTRHTIDFKERRQYKHFTCPQCSQKLRVPRGKGRLRVTCAKCRYKFEVRS